MDLRSAARTVLFPARALWAIRNRFGLIKFAVGTSPHLDNLALAKWREAISKSRIYLEYGSGGSTIEAAKSVDQVVSVETDGRFLAAVERAIAETPAASAELRPMHINIGLTEMWGRPLAGLRTASRLARWRRYPSAPWEYFERTGLRPDFIFVDGRFRVASILESILRLPPGSDCQIMLDDFDRRKDRYGAVLEFADQLEFAGRAIIFRKKRDFDREKCVRLLHRFQADPE